LSGFSWRLVNSTKRKTKIQKFSVLGFAALCTAGILYPLDWIMGIRLGKEDELEGLDLTGRRRKGDFWKIKMRFFSSWRKLGSGGITSCS